jgi:hypothetical protein
METQGRNKLKHLARNKLKAHINIQRTDYTLGDPGSKEDAGEETPSEGISIERDLRERE